MNTKNLPLRTTIKAVMIAMLLGVAGMTKVAKAQSTWEQSQNYLFYLVYADYQTCEHLMPERENSIPDAIRRNLLPVNEGSMLAWIWDEETNPGARRSGLIGLAKNEKEGFQVFFREQEKERNLRIVVDTSEIHKMKFCNIKFIWRSFFGQKEFGKKIPQMQIHWRKLWFLILRIRSNKHQLGTMWFFMLNCGL